MCVYLYIYIYIYAYKLKCTTAVIQGKEKRGIGIILL